MILQANKQRVCVDVPKDLLRDFKRAIFEHEEGIQKGDLTDCMIDAMDEWATNILRNHNIKPNNKYHFAKVTRQLRESGESV